MFASDLRPSFTRRWWTDPTANSALIGKLPCFGKSSIRWIIEAPFFTFLTTSSWSFFNSGGGIILSEPNRELLSSRGTVFYLATPIETQLERTSKDKDRPLLKNGDPGKILKELHIARESLYEEVSDYVVNTEGKSSQEVSAEIIKLVKNYG